jgi:adenylyltransferase/sulfurtransferase
VQLIDVREQREYDIAHIAGAILIPLGELPGRLSELDSSSTYVVTCHRGGRSRQACALLREAGFSRVRNLEGGIDAWAELVDPSLPRY